ncbi:hypothetical protein ABGB16_16160 [Micromonospora sp. B11E3]|uniref:hypothetical protein n=1 Tax=Micromonospora sp. B11E3 TaxID=3153562 RepID=UPI00325D5534
MKRVIYPATRAVENAVSLPGIRPIRLFPVLWPLWQVETTAEVYDKQDFELIDHFIVRAIHEGDIHHRSELIHFLGLPAGLVERCLAFLQRIGHLTMTESALHLTDLGQRSVNEGVRYVATMSRLTILVERQTGAPFPRPYYDGNVPVLDTPEIEEGQVADRTRFRPVVTTAQFNPQVVQWLANRPDRAQYNLPSQFRNLQQSAVREGFLPSYLIETADHRILAYTNVSEKRDEFLEGLCTKTSVEHLIEAQGSSDPADVWRKWLAQSTTFAAGRLQKTRAGIWQVVLPGTAFGDPPRISLSRIGSYQFRDNHFIQIWCADVEIRQRALKERSLGIATLPEVTCQADLETRIRDLAGNIEVAAVSIAELREYAESKGDERRLSRLLSLAQERA